MAEQYIDGRFRLRRKLISGDAKRGIPDLWEAQDAGDVYFVKLWRRGGDDLSDVKALWNREVRGLMRLQGYPGAGELFVRLQQLGVDDRQYFAVLDGGRRQLLSTILQHRSRYSWLQNLAEFSRRRSLWEGLLRIAEGVAVLHGEGTLHRSLSADAVFTAPEGQGDFRLSGFEWSLRVASREGAAQRTGRLDALRAGELARGSGEYSTASDWFDFGVLAAQLFGVDIKLHRKRESLRLSVDRLNALNRGEREFILQLLAESAEDRLCDDKTVLQTIRNVISELSVSSAASGRSLVLAVRIVEGGNLAQAVEVASKGEAGPDRPLAQRAWIERDLRGDVRVIARAGAHPYYVLRGEQLSYKLKEWMVGASATWSIGYCESVESVPRSTPNDQHFSLGQRALDIQLYPKVRNSQQTIRDRAAPWDRIFPFRKAREALAPYLRDVHDFFRVTQQLDTVITVAGICPVEILTVHRTESETEVEVTPREDPDRTDLAAFLGMDSPASQIRDWFRLGAEVVSVEDEDDPQRDSYSLLERRTVKFDASAETSWRFAGARPCPAGPLYRFICQGSPPVTEGALNYLARNFGGTIAQIRRRQKAIEEMRSHESLLRLIDDPLRASHSDEEVPPTGRVALKLDDSKRDALDRLWRMQPSFAVQGPPGTGKTTLIMAFADRLLTADPSAQVLITAHSHHTVDDVLGKLEEIFASLPEQDRPIMLRLGARQADPHDPSAVTHRQLVRLQKSELASKMPAALRRRLDETVKASAAGNANNQHLRTMQVLVQDAANLTFSTSNAADLAELADRGRRFDWSIIEEAGKAHGFDMAIALQESHRLLLIGDHFQLPPFNALLFKRLLSDPLRVRNALTKGAQFAPGLVDSAIVEDEEDRTPFVERCERWRGMVDLFAMIFTKSSAADDHKPGPAATLTDQHRMHPTIANVVGRIFYPDPNSVEGTLINSPEETRERFEAPPPFTLRTDSWLPEQRLVWVDVPWLQNKAFAEGETDGLFESRVEAEALLKVLEELRPAPDRDCELQILSPYNDQLDMLRSMIRGELADRLAHVAAAPFAITKNKRMGATVDEFQGSEADIVVVSLVRNNALVPWKSVGFLREANRMNVLLSRARHKLIIVGSWDFFASRCDEHTGEDVDYAYLRRMMQVLATAKTDGALARIGAPA
ncbi:MAG TPA: AAA domain-containing protein [Methyloceanibacter sp.]|nr:AAA domain-containing protein [Methyloceanibacter sp.]